MIVEYKISYCSIQSVLHMHNSFTVFILFATQPATSGKHTYTSTISTTLMMNNRIHYFIVFNNLCNTIK